jgi:hypothetical protein
MATHECDIIPVSSPKNSDSFVPKLSPQDLLMYTRSRLVIGIHIEILLVVVGAVVTRAPSALACSCAQMRIERHVFPVNGSTGLPTNTRIHVILPRFVDALAQELPQEYRLVDETGVAVSVQSSVSHHLITLKPAAEPVILLNELTGIATWSACQG